MRTLGSEVVRGRWGWSAAGRGRTKSLIADDVAVLVCSTMCGLGAVRLADSRGFKELAQAQSLGSHATAAQSRAVMRPAVTAATGSSPSPCRGPKVLAEPGS